MVVADRFLQEIFNTCLLRVLLEPEVDLRAAQVVLVLVGKEIRFGTETSAQVTGDFEYGSVSERHFAVNGHSYAGFEMSVERTAEDHVERNRAMGQEELTCLRIDA